MRFLILTQYYPPEVSAAPVRLTALARELGRLGHQVEVFTAMPNHPVGRIFDGYRGKCYLKETVEGVTVHRAWLYAAMGTGIRRIFNYLSFAFTALLLLGKATTPDVIFVESPPLFLSIPARWWAWRWRVPFIFNIADLWPDSVRELGLMRDGPALRLAERLERWTYRKARFLTAVTEGIRTTLLEKKGIPPEQILFLPNGVDVDVVRPLPYDQQLANTLGVEGKTVITYVGTHGYAHGLEVVIRTAKLLAHENVVFLQIGDGSDKPRIMEMAAAEGATNIQFIDSIPPAEIPRYYSISLAGLSTLRNSPFFAGTRPVKIFSIMASGLPVLYSGAGEGARLVEEANAGVVLPAEDAEALAQAIRALRDDPARVKAFGESGRDYVVRNLSWPALVGAWVQELEARSAKSK